MKEDEKRTNLHEGHRKRLLARFERSGFDSFEEHNILELLLFYSIPRADTNPIAHELIRRFGSLYGVLTAQPDELCQVRGVGPASAAMLHTMFCAAREASFRHITAAPLRTWEQLRTAAIEWYAGQPPRTVAAFLLNEQQLLLSVKTIASGVAHIPPSYHEAVRQAAEDAHASGVVLLHNHQDGVMLPSEEDLVLTAALFDSLSACGLRLLEHLIVHEFDAVPILDQCVGRAVSAYPADSVDPDPLSFSPEA